MTLSSAPSRTATVGLDRLPHSITAVLGEAATNLITISNHLDELVGGDRAALDAITRSEGEGDRILHDLVAAISASRRHGPDRVTLVHLGQAIDDVVDAVEALAWSWSRRPLSDLEDLLLAIRDGARDVAHAVAALEQAPQRESWLARCHERDAEIRRLSRSGRALLLVEQTDALRAICAHELLERVADVHNCCVRLRERIRFYGLA